MQTSNLKVVHVFNKKNTHINPGIIHGIHEHKDANHEHAYLICNLNHHERLIGEPDAYKDLEAKGCNIKHINSFFALLSATLKNSGVLVLHGTVSPFRKNLFFFLLLFIFSPQTLKKTILVAWGAGDFAPQIGLLSKIYRRILNKIKCIVTLSSEDFNSCSASGHLHTIQLNYINKKNISPAPSGLIKNKAFKTIMISHSGWPHNNHLKSFSAISNKIQGDFRVICPLAYGDSEYINSVIEAGTQCFGDKFTYFTDLLEINSYEEVLKDVDVYITAATIQTGLFAVTSCLANGAKIYCDSNLYDSLSNSGFKVFHFDHLKEADEKSLFEASNSLTEINRAAYLKQYHDFDSLALSWNSTYDS